MSRPPFEFHGFIGQRKKVEPLIREVRGAKACGQPACHTAISGLSGTGKSTLARALAQEYGARFLKLSGEVARSKLLVELRNVHEGDFLFIDEAHGLAVALQEILYRVIDREPIERVDTGEPLLVPPFTLLLATDQPGSLKNALRKRIPTVVHLNPYTDAEMKVIVERVATKEEILLTAQGASLLARTCHGLPRTAEHRVRKLHYHFPVTQQVSLTTEQVKEFLAAFDIDESGLGEHERKYLEFLFRERSASLETLAAILTVDPLYVSRQVEHALHHSGLIAIAQSGRQLTRAGKEWARNQQAIQTLDEEYHTG